MPIVKMPGTACTLECDLCAGLILHRRAWGEAKYTCVGCGVVSDRRPAVRIAAEGVAVTGSTTCVGGKVFVTVGHEEVSVAVGPDDDADEIERKLTAAIAEAADDNWWRCPDCGDLAEPEMAEFHECPKAPA